uniref:Uncharacterized protein n=1 Tax=Nothoprocta perdicaria TaxID=30464 RepID=A0A8C6YTF2_NOTPE
GLCLPWICLNLIWQELSTLPPTCASRALSLGPHQPTDLLKEVQEAQMPSTSCPVFFLIKTVCGGDSKLYCCADSLISLLPRHPGIAPLLMIPRNPTRRTEEGTENRE